MKTEKIDPALLLKMSDPQTEPNEQIPVIIRTALNLDTFAKQILAAADIERDEFEPSSPILAGYLTATTIQNLTDYPWILTIRLSRQLTTRAD